MKGSIMWSRVVFITVLSAGVAALAGCAGRLEYRASPKVKYMGPFVLAKVPAGDLGTLSPAPEPVPLPLQLEGRYRVFEMPLGDKDQEPFLAAFPAQPESNEPLYIDLDRDGDFADEEPVAAKPQTGDIVYGPVGVTVRQAGRQGPYRFWVMYRRKGWGTRWHVFPGCYTYGTAVIDGKEYRAALVDNNGTGRYNDYCWSGPWQGDWYYLDLDDNGVFDGSGEWFMYSHQVCLAGKWYAVEASADGTRLTFSRPDFELGEVRTGLEDFRFKLTDGSGAVVARGRAGVVEVPTGKYKVIGVNFYPTDDDGRRWNLWQFHVGPPGDVEVEAEVATEFLFGPPFTISLQTEPAGPYRAGQKVEFRLVITGRRGWTYKLAGIASKYMSAPEIVITDEAGATIHVGVCERLKHSWTIPEGLRGKFEARPKLRVTGFDHEAKSVALEIR